MALTVPTELAGCRVLMGQPAQRDRRVHRDREDLLARVEALSRNHACAFLVDLDAREISVVDTNGTVTDTDDVVLQARRLPTTVSVARPDGGSAITFESIGGSLYRVQFDADGHVTSGTGELVLYGGEHYGRVIIYSAGGVRHQRWNGSSWIAGA